MIYNAPPLKLDIESENEFLGLIIKGLAAQAFAQGFAS
jgi:hypothetical protein